MEAHQEVLLPGNVGVTRSNVGCYVCLGALVIIHLVMMAILVGSMASMAPEIKTTLDDVGRMVPEMHSSLLELGVMIPEIRTGMKILEQLCLNDNRCTMPSV